MTPETGFTPADRSLLDPDARLHALGFALPTDPWDPTPRGRVCSVCFRQVPETQGGFIEGSSGPSWFAHVELDPTQPGHLAADCCAALLYSLSDACQRDGWTILRRLLALRGLDYDRI